MLLLLGSRTLQRMSLYKETQKLTFRNIRTNEIRASGSSHLYYLGVLLVKFVSFAQSGCSLFGCLFANLFVRFAEVVNKSFVTPP